QPHALDQLEQPVLLAVADHPLRAREHGVVVGEDRARRALAEEIAIHPSRAGDETVGGGSLDQLPDLAAGALGRDAEGPVLDEAARIDEVVDVLARRPSAGVVPSLDRLGPRL